MGINARHTNPILRSINAKWNFSEWGQKWIIYDNVSREISRGKLSNPHQTFFKRVLYPHKVLFSVWRDIRRILFFELLPQNETTNSDFYWGQLQKMSKALHETPSADKYSKGCFPTRQCYILKMCSPLKIESNSSWVNFIHFREKTHFLALELIFVSSSWWVYIYIKFEI